MRRYELMLLFRPDLEDDKLQSAVEKVTRAIVNAGGALTKVSPWGKRRMAYEIQHFREASYFLLHFDIAPSAIREIERGLLISEEILRHLVTVLEDRGEAQDDEELGVEGEVGEGAPAVAERVDRFEAAPSDEVLASGEAAASDEDLASGEAVASGDDTDEVSGSTDTEEVAIVAEETDVAEAAAPAATTGRSRRAATDEES